MENSTRTKSVIPGARIVPLAAVVPTRIFVTVVAAVTVVARVLVVEVERTAVLLKVTVCVTVAADSVGAGVARRVAPVVDMESALVVVVTTNVSLEQWPHQDYNPIENTYHCSVPLHS